MLGLKLNHVSKRGYWWLHRVSKNLVNIVSGNGVSMTLVDSIWRHNDMYCYVTIHSQGKAFCLLMLEFKCHLWHCSSQEVDVSLSHSVVLHHIGSSNGLVPNGAKPLPASMLNYCQWNSKLYVAVHFSVEIFLLLMANMYVKAIFQLSTWLQGPMS